MKEFFNCKVHGIVLRADCQVLINRKKNNREQLKCKVCGKEYRKKHYELNKERVSLQVKKWKSNNQEKVRQDKKKWQLANKERHHQSNVDYRNNNRERLNIMARVREYGITIEEYKAMIVAQDNKCAICFLPETKIWRGKQTELCLDHCHKNGGLRQLLCFQCNLGLGAFKDDPQRLQSAITYLKKHQQ